MIGYKVTAKNFDLNYFRTYDGWSEGEPKLESKAKETAAKQVVKQVLTQGAKMIVGGPAGAVVKVADIVSKPLQGMGIAASKLIADNLKNINHARAEQGLLVVDIVVTLTGDFEGAYQIARPKDLEELPKLLALIPAKDSTDQFMGESVLESVFIAQVNFARHLYNRGAWTPKQQTIVPLELGIDL